MDSFIDFTTKIYAKIALQCAIYNGVQCTKAIAQKPIMYCLRTLFDIILVQFSHHITLVECDIKLSIISILIKLNTNVKCKQKRSKY